MNIKDIDYLIVVAEHRNIGRAAENLGLTQPALTRAVARLEALAGQRLFERHPKGVILTQAGEAFLCRAQRIRIEYDDALRELHQMKSGELGLLRVGYSPSVDEDMVIAATQRLLLDRPAARLTLVERLMQDLLDQLIDGKLDMIVAPQPQPPSAELAITRLYRDRLLIVADMDHPLFRCDVVQLADVAAEPWLLPSRHIRVRRLLDATVTEAGLQPLNVRVETDFASLGHFRLLCGTRMLGICSGLQTAMMRKLGLGTLSVEGLMPDREIVVMRRALGYASPLSQRLIQLLEDQSSRLREPVP